MNVCVITDIYPSEDNPYKGIFVHELCRKLVEFKCQVHVVTNSKKGQNSPRIIDGVHVHNLNPIRSFLPFFVEKVINTVKKYQIDALHAHLAFPGGFIGTITKKITSKPLTVTVHGYDATCIQDIGYGLLCNPIYRKIVKKTLNDVDKIIAVSKSVKKRIIQLGVKDKKIKVIYNGIDLKKFSLNRDILERSNIMKKNRNWNNKKILLSVGSLVPVKGQKYLIEAMKAVTEEIPDTLLLICGDGLLKKGLKELVKRLDLQGYVKFMGTIHPKEMPLYYVIADIFILSSIIEGHPISLLESMAYSKPIIATKVGGIPETIKTQENGILVEKQCPEKLAEAICAVLQDKKFAETMGRNARKSIKNFSLDTQAKQILAVYQELQNY